MCADWYVIIFNRSKQYKNTLKKILRIANLKLCTIHIPTKH